MNMHPARTILWTRVVGLLLLLAVPLPASARDAEQAARFANANESYQQGRYDAAADEYRALIADGVQDAAAWYNLGNAYLRQDDPGRARACYERSLALSPRDADTRANLALLKQGLADAEPDVNPVLAFARAFTWNELAAATSAAWFACGLLGAWWLRRRTDHSGLGALVALGLLLAGSGLLALRLHHDAAGRRAVVIPAEIRLHEGPARDEATRGSLHAGSCVQVQKSDGDWREVSLAGGVHGWVRAAELETL